jgi:sulfate transport system ATP-binding protein
MSITLEDLVKRYAGHTVVNRVSLHVGAGELFVLLGPSGSGKSTVLRMISGLAEVDGGRVLLGGRDVTGVPPRKRGVGFVFQHYALFGHMTAAENIEFALRIRGVPRAGRRRRRDELLELVGLVGLDRRFPHQLSGGQQQRVALARALAHRPEVLLFDEPFGALDARIRSELRRTLRGIQRELGVTTLFVTHDQEEAFELADRLGVMNHGRLLEVGPPTELYQRPETEFVATFLGRANLMVGECAASEVRLGPVRLPMGTVASAPDRKRVQILFRPEDVAVKTSAEALEWPQFGEGVVEDVAFSGSIERLRLRLPALPGVRPIAPPPGFGADAIQVEATRSQHLARRFPLRRGDRAWVGLRRVHALPHPGLNLLLLADEGDGAARLGGEIARRAHARMTLLAAGADEDAMRRILQTAREKVGGGLPGIEMRAVSQGKWPAIGNALSQQEFDLVIHGWGAADSVRTVEALLACGAEHVLLVPDRCPLPGKALICVAAGEPSKDDVLFAGRLARHLGAEATLLTVAPDEPAGGAGEIGRRFLDAAARTLSLLGVEARVVVARGRPGEVIAREIEQGGHDLIVLGTPLPAEGGRIVLEGVVASLLATTRGVALLVSRSAAAGR